MSPASVLLLAVLAQPAEHRVEATDRRGELFCAAGHVGGDLWERVRGAVRVDARTSSTPGRSGARLDLRFTRGAETWTVELDRMGGMDVDADLPGPGGLVHAALALDGLARVSRAGQTLAERAPLRALLLTTGYHADDGTFRTLRAGRSGDLELLVHVEGLPGGEVLDLGVEDPEIRVDRVPLPSSPLADASAPPWPGARAQTGVGGSGSGIGSAAYGAVAPLVPPRSLPGMPAPSTPAPANARPAVPLTSAPAPANAAPAQPLPGAPGPLPGAPPALEPATPASTPALPLPAAPAPGNAAPAVPLAPAPAPANGSPASPLPASPGPANAVPPIGDIRPEEPPRPTVPATPPPRAPWGPGDTPALACAADVPPRRGAG